MPEEIFRKQLRESQMGRWLRLTVSYISHRVKKYCKQTGLLQGRKTLYGAQFSWTVGQIVEKFSAVYRTKTFIVVFMRERENFCLYQIEWLVISCLPTSQTVVIKVGYLWKNF